MNKEQTKKAIEIMQAWVDGKEIQFRNDITEAWRGNGPNHPHVGWDWMHFEYRVKPDTLKVVIGKWNDKPWLHVYRADDIDPNEGGWHTIKSIEVTLDDVV